MVQNTEKRAVDSLFDDPKPTKQQDKPLEKREVSSIPTKKKNSSIDINDVIHEWEKFAVEKRMHGFIVKQFRDRLLQLQ